MKGDFATNYTKNVVTPDPVKGFPTTRATWMKILCIVELRRTRGGIEERYPLVEPVFFLKPDTALLPPGQAFYLA